MIIKKASGEEVEFSVDKLRTSLSRSGASKQVIESILQEVKSHLFPGISTKRIYKLAFSLLKKEAKPSAARYQLKNAIMELGPSGFPFEKFIAASKSGKRVQPNGKPISKGTIENYSYTLALLKTFCTEKSFES